MCFRQHDGTAVDNRTEAGQRSDTLIREPDPSIDWQFSTELKYTEVMFLLEPCWSFPAKQRHRVVWSKCAASVHTGWRAATTKWTVQTHYQLISKQVSPFPERFCISKCRKERIIASNALWLILQSGRLSGRLICVFFPPSFVCFDNKDSLSHPITSCQFPALFLTCLTSSPTECVTHWDQWSLSLNCIWPFSLLKRTMVQTQFKSNVCVMMYMCAQTHYKKIPQTLIYELIKTCLTSKVIIVSVFLP